MARISLLLVASAVLLQSCHDAPEAASAAKCAAFKNLDLANLHDDPEDGLLEDVWADWVREQPTVAWNTASPTGSFRVFTSPGGLTLDPTSREIVGRRSTGGWEIYARSLTPPYPGQHWTPWRAVSLSQQGDQRLTAILRNPCLWAAPRFLDAEVRLSNGRYDARPDGPSTGYLVVDGQRSWGGWQHSWSVGPPGELRSLLLSEAFGLPQERNDEIDAEGWLDQPS